jgi:small subunit ribosomal protein S19
MAKKEFSYRGKSIDELKAMSLNDLAELFPASARRVIKRGFTEEEKRFLANMNKSGQIKTHCRDMIILPDMVGKTINVYNGKAFVPIIIQAEMISHRLGEYAHSKKRVGHGSAGVGATRSSNAVSVR